MRILVADDEPNTRDALAEVLREEGHSVTTVSGGRFALESLGATPYDLVITDLNMPDVDGLEVIEMTRMLQPTAGIVVITAYGERFNRSFAEKGEIVLLSKPFRLNEILSVVDSVSKQRVARGVVSTGLASTGAAPSNGNVAAGDAAERA